MSVEDLQKTDDMTEHSDNEITLGFWLDRPYVQLAIGIIVAVMLIFLALKAGFSLWLMNKLGYGERLVNGRGEPDFWSIGKTLDAYQRPAGDAQRTVKQEVASVAPGKKERFTDPKILAALL
jgi:hypothetical protein